MSKYDLERFIDAQGRHSYEYALSEIKNGEKRGHWMWFIFPQVRGLGFSEMAHIYGIENLEEAKEYLENDVLCGHLKEISNALLEVKETDPEEIFGYIDAMKLKSSMTLFDLASPNDIFDKVLQKFYNGERDNKTIEILEQARQQQTMQQ